MNRSVQRLHEGFRFCRFPDFNAPEAVFGVDYDDSTWESVTVPHDWAIHGEFHPENDKSCDEIEADGIHEPIVNTGRTGALPILGQGIYRYCFYTPEADRTLCTSLDFDGVMWEAEVYINGQKVFFNHFGYQAFSVDITRYLHYGEKNLLAVKACVYPDCSRWYPGAGIFRNIYLVKKAPVHIRRDGVWFRQQSVDERDAEFTLSVAFSGFGGECITVEIVSPTGEIVLTMHQQGDNQSVSIPFHIPQPKLWDVDAPLLYTARVHLLDAVGCETDSVSVPFGIRSCQFTFDRGMILNGRTLKINGVCLHHDLGSLGAAVSMPALKRRLRILKEMGANSIRTSHNPPSPELLTLCDEMGFLVMVESFDEWEIPKIKNGYARYFRQHAEKDLENIIVHFRNHPCVFLWSIGNEILEQCQPDGWKPAKLLYDTAKRIDPTRAVTCGFSFPHQQFDNHLADFVDVVGINYKPHLYLQYHQEFPHMKFLGSETASTVSSRGIYHIPAEVSIPMNTHEDLTASSYELEAPSWAYFAERELAAQQDCPFVAGEYVWTGFDYLGEPTPYYTEWPSRSSYFGILDTAGLPKNRYYLYQACWSKQPVLHIFPHWNWPKMMEGEIVPVHVFTNYPKAELFINGVSFGVRQLEAGGEDDLATIKRFRMIWDNAVYTPGTVHVVAYDEQGHAAQYAEVKTAGAPFALRLSGDRTSISADGEDLLFVTAEIVDRNGVLCPLADNRVSFRTEAGLEVLTTDSGDQRETESFWRPDKKALSGKCVVCLRSIKGRFGPARITAEAEGLHSASLSLICRDFC